MFRKSTVNDEWTRGPSEASGPGNRFVVGTGDMATLIRDKDWSATPLGPFDRWPQSLRTTVSLCLASNFPINIIWGPGRTQIYNDGYQVLCGEAHPRALGEDYAVSWASAWPAIGEPFERALGGETSFLENQRMFLTRNGYLEETFFTFSTSPIRDESGGIGGLFHPVTETTSTMLAERRTRALRDLTTNVASSADSSDLARRAIETLSSFPFDLPFMLVYAFDARDDTYRLVAHQGVPLGTEASPMRLDAAAPSPWATSGSSSVAGQTYEVAAIRPLLGDTACGPYLEPPDRALVVCIGDKQLDAHGARAPLLVVVGLSPRLPVDGAYLGFVELLAAALTAALRAANARDEQRRHLKALAEIDRAKTAFFSNISHEFRTPLTLLLGPLEDALAHPGSLPAATSESLSLAHRNALRLLRLVNALLDFSRIEAGRLQGVFEPIDVGTLTADLVSSFRAICEGAGLALEVEVEPIGVPVYVDRDMWEKIVLNLVSNAFKFTLKGSIRVELKMDPQREAVLLAVSDTGVGIADDELARVFERFHRIEGSGGRSIEGSGIGLSLVQELVRLHGGTVDVASMLGKGSTFTICIPCGSAHLPAECIVETNAAAVSTSAARAFIDEANRWLPESEVPTDAASSPASFRAATGRVLVVDDNHDMRAYVSRLLTEAGYKVEAVGDGLAALALAQQWKPDLVVSDVMMPLLDGYGLLARWRAEPSLKSIPFILLSARAGDEAKIEGIEAGADDYLVKPFSARELVARVSSNLTLARERREALLMAVNADLERQVADRTRERGRTWQVTPDLLCVLADDSVFESVNPAWKEVLGWTAETLAGKPLEEMTHPDDRTGTRKAIDTLLAGQPVVRFANRLLAKDGDYRWLEWVAVAEGGRLYCSARDITDAKRRERELADAQDALRHAQKMDAIGQLTGGIAHDFNNILMVLTGGLELIDRQHDPARRERLLKGMRQAAERGGTLTRQLLAFSRKQALNPSPVDLRSLLDGMRVLLDRSLRGDVGVSVQLPERLWIVEIDRGELELVILNLCVNSRDAMPKGGTIIVGAENMADFSIDGSRGDFVRLYVTDQGTGMSPEVLSRLFEPFFTTKDVGGGSGLGLAQVHGFAKQSGGGVDVQSRVDQGTTVSVYLPRATGTTVVEHRPEPLVAAPDLRVSVLMVEDDDEVAALVLEMLAEIGCEVVRVSSAAAALGALADQRSIDLVFSDIMMPGGMDGLELVAEIRRRRPTLPVLLTSGFSEAARERAQAQEVTILAKPYSIDALTDAIRRVLSQTPA